MLRSSLLAIALLWPVALPAQIPAGEYAARRAGLAQVVQDGPVLVLGARSPVRAYERFVQHPALTYLAGLSEPGAALVLLVRDTKIAAATLFVTPRTPAHELASGPMLGVTGATQLTGLAARASEELKPYLDSLLTTNQDTVLHVLADYRPRAPAGALLSYDHQYVTALLASHPAVGVRPASLATLRGHKSPAEVALIRKAVHITVLAQQEALRALRPGLNEFELQALIEYTFRRYGADRPAFASIVGSGPNATALHYRDNDRFMAGGDLVILDVGASYRGYAADVTRTLPVNGTFTPAQRAIYQAVREAQAAAERELVRPMAGRRAADSASRAVLADRLTELGLLESPAATYDCDTTASRQCPQLELYYMHKLGHPVGLEVHDEGPRTTTPFTLEPGVYVRANLLTEVIPDTPRNRAFKAAIAPAFRRYAGIGVRIEDVYVLTGQGLEWLSRAPREVDEIEALMRRPRSAGPAPREAAMVEWYRQTAPPVP